jgi:hypothetical protein
VARQQRLRHGRARERQRAVRTRHRQQAEFVGRPSSTRYSSWTCGRFGLFTLTRCRFWICIRSWKGQPQAFSISGRVGICLSTTFRSMLRAEHGHRAVPKIIKIQRRLQTEVNMHGGTTRFQTSNLILHVLSF